MEAEVPVNVEAAAAAATATEAGQQEGDAASGAAPRLKRLKQHPLASSIKRMMQADDDVGKISKVSPAIIGKALELFLGRLCSSVADVAAQYHSRIVMPAHLKACVNSNAMFDFLKDVDGISAAADLPPPEEAPAPKPKRQRSRKVAPAAEGEEGAAVTAAKSPRKRAPRASTAKKRRQDDGSSEDDGAQPHESDPDSDGTGSAKPARKRRAAKGGSGGGGGGGGRGRGRGRAHGRGRGRGMAEAESDVELSDAEGQPVGEAAAPTRQVEPTVSAAPIHAPAAEVATDAAQPPAASLPPPAFAVGHAAEEDDYDED